MRVAVVQTNPKFGDVAFNIQQAIQLMRRKGADLYVLPELFNTGYNIRSRAEIAGLAESANLGPTFDAIWQWCRERRCYVVYGFAERKGVSLYNSANFIGPKGRLGTYRKTHLFGRENLFFKKGDSGFRVYSLPLGKVGIMICFDWYYPESARTLALRGAQLIAHPANLVLPNCPEGMKTRCLENRVFAAVSDRVGTENRGKHKLRYIGMSEIVSPRGRILGRLSGNRPGIYVASVNLKEANDKSVTSFNHLFRGRRPRYYDF